MSDTPSQESLDEAAYLLEFSNANGATDERVARRLDELKADIAQYDGLFDKYATVLAKLKELKAERDSYLDAVNCAYKFQKGLTNERDRLVEALRKVLDGGITDHQVPCELFKQKGICNCGLVEWQRATRALLAEIGREASRDRQGGRMRYKVISEIEIVKFNQEVTDHLNKGWRLVGSPFSTLFFQVNEAGGHGDSFMNQAMTELPPYVISSGGLNE
jgi:hypothetical protein